ncbi:hypothetical protein D3C72_1780970 [compost metagenome]
MKTLLDKREARNPLEEGMSMLPYLGVYQRMHRRRWGAAVLASVAAGGLALWWNRRNRPTR